MQQRLSTVYLQKIELPQNFMVLTAITNKVLGDLRVPRWSVVYISSKFITC
jgi:hypothetical protein